MWDLAFFGRQDRVSHLSTEIPLTHQRVEWWQRRMKQLIKHVSDTWPRVPIWVRKLHRVGPVGGASCESWGLRTRFRAAMPASRVLSPSTPRTAAHLAGIVSDRSVHLPADDWRHTGREDHGGQSTFSNFFTDIRIHTIREMQDQVTRDLGVPAYDFGDSWEGWQAHQDMVHPKKVRPKPPFASLSLSARAKELTPLWMWCAQFPGGPVYMQALLHHIWMESQGRDSWRPSKRRPVAPVGSFLE